MKFSEHWLRTMANPPIGSPELCERLTMAGLEVEEATLAAPPFSGVVVGNIERVDPHPNADRLKVCIVDIGVPERLTVVCGAPNAVAGMKAPCATIGARLPAGLVITRASVRGVESQGMLCSAKELGIADDAAGLLALPADAVVGANLRDALDLDDTLLTLKLTPNRADCLSLLGIAREVAAFTDTSVTQPRPPTCRSPHAPSATCASKTSEACPRFVSRTIEGIDARAATPEWMKRRLERSGIRSISAVVDVTNYVMLELGQPLHAYDDRLLEGSIVVRFARPGEKLTLLNGQVLDLDKDLLLVADTAKPLGLAGIMGGEHSGINETTTTVLLEGAYWSPAVIQGKSRRLGFVSDAGYRFERGVDFGGCKRAVERATQLIVEICGGRAGPIGDVQGAMPRRDPVRVRPARVTRLLGIEISDKTIAALFARLGFACERAGADFLVTPPSYRFDLAIEEDFIEEIARLHGYDAIPAVAAAHVQTMLPRARGCRCADHRQARARRARLAGGDHVQFRELVAGSHALSGDGGSSAPVAVLNPIASHLDIMRTTLAGGLIEVLSTNLARRAGLDPRVRGGPMLCARRRRLRPADAAWRPRLRGRAPRAMGRAQTRRRHVRRQGRSRSTGGTRVRSRQSAPSIQPSIRAAPRGFSSTAIRSAGWESCTRAPSARSTCPAHRCCSRWTCFRCCAGLCLVHGRSRGYPSSVAISPWSSTTGSRPVTFWPP